jgi:hypothetical protein
MNQHIAVDTAGSSRRRFFELLGGSVLGATAVAAHIGGIKRAEAAQFQPLWTSAKILIGNSPKDQAPRSSITCPMFFDDGHFANGYHTFDFSNPTNVISTLTINKDTIDITNYSSYSLAVADTEGTDGFHYVLTAAEGIVTGGTGYFSGVSRAIGRCKFKVPAYNPLLLIACVDCVVILVWS